MSKPRALRPSCVRVNSMDYSVIIPAYNEAQWLPATLRGLDAAMKTLPHRGEIIVVDNNSTDRTGEVAAAHGTMVVFEPVNQIARARNRGAQQARGRYLLFVDADTLVSGPLLGEALRLLTDNHACGGGALVSAGSGANRVARLGIRVWNSISRHTRFAAGCFLFVRRDAFDEVGGFNEKLYASEELWLSRRLKTWGRRRRLPFTIITAERVLTSPRKTQWYSPARLMLVMALMLIFPWAVRYRALCGFWYKRPVIKQ